MKQNTLSEEKLNSIKIPDCYANSVGFMYQYRTTLKRCFHSISISNQNSVFLLPLFSGSYSGLDIYFYFLIGEKKARIVNRNVLLHQTKSSHVSNTLSSR